MEYTKVARLIMITEENNNKFYDLFDHGDGTMHVEYGRVDSTKLTKTYSSREWDSIYRSKTKKGYQDVTSLRTEKVENIKDDKSKDIDDTLGITNINIRSLFRDLQNYANVVVQENYKVKSTSVTQAMVDEAQKILNDLTSSLKIGADIKKLNPLLLRLYAVIPRKMQKVQHHLFKDIVDDESLKTALAKVSNEQDTLDSMAAQVLKNTKVQESESKTEKGKKKTTNILDDLGIEIEECAANEIKIIKDALGPDSPKFGKAFKVKNLHTEKKYEEEFEHITVKKEELFWHGSRNQNWYFILQKGLLIRPSGAIHSGSMWGDAVYFADKAKKSIGYSSFRGSYWAGGNSNKAYLALYRVSVGNQKHIHRHDSSCYSITKDKLLKDNYHSVFAHGGADLINNEYIIYDIKQCTIQYLVEIN